MSTTCDSPPPLVTTASHQPSDLLWVRSYLPCTPYLCVHGGASLAADAVRSVVDVELDLVLAGDGRRRLVRRRGQAVGVPLSARLPRQAVDAGGRGVRGQVRAAQVRSHSLKKG